MCRCIPHTLYVGNSFMAWTSLALCAHHSFGAWHGDKRLQERYGEVIFRSRGLKNATIEKYLPEDWRGCRGFPAATSPQCRTTLCVSTPLNCFGTCFNPATCNANRGYIKRRFEPILRAGGSVRQQDSTLTLNAKH
jgi:hypothetical protein